MTTTPCDSDSLRNLAAETTRLLGGGESRFDPAEGTASLATIGGCPVRVQQTLRGILVCLQVTAPCPNHSYPALLAAADADHNNYVPALTADGALAVLWQAPAGALDATSLAQAIEEIEAAATAWLAAAHTGKTAPQTG